MYRQYITGQRQNTPATTVSATISYLRTLNDNLMNEMKFGYNRNHFNLQRSDQNDSLEDLSGSEAEDLPDDHDYGP